MATTKRPARHRVGEPRFVLARSTGGAVIAGASRGGAAGCTATGACPRDGRLDLPDVLGRRPAAAADDADVVKNEAPRVGRHVLRRAEIDVAPLDIARLSGVRLSRQTQLRHGRHPLDRLEHRRRPDGAVDAENRRAPALQLRRELLRRRAVERVAVLFGRHLRDDRPIGHAAHRVDRGADLVHVAERLEDEQVDAAVGQRLRLLAEVLARFVDAGLSPRLDPDAERPDRAGDVGLAACRGGAARDPRPLDVDRLELVGETERAELEAVRAEGIGLDDVGAGAEVVPVNVRDELRLRQVERIEALVDEDPLRVQHRPHRAVADEHAIVEGL